ncbi:hypothetical protein BKA64DRAFT_760358 [Cadophora sp. MPI-SDFR-AT-0126]|nr:hypothetical protein BKA64DRAFT_760358 [Leotiomycetes sp. MPI-SDFR-AT-0126]
MATSPPIPNTPNNITNTSNPPSSPTMEAPSIQSPTVSDLRNNTPLWYKLHVLIYDLHNFRTAPHSQARLDSITSTSYVGPPYFTAAEAQMIKSTRIDTSPAVHPGVKKAKSPSQSQSESQAQSEQQNMKRLEVVIEETLNERLERRLKKREESGDFRVCAAHDLAPILEKALGVSARDLQRDEEFLGLVERCELELGDGEVWRGVLKRGSGGGKKIGNGKGKGKY